jgi:hypothetical protein
MEEGQSPPSQISSNDHRFHGIVDNPYIYPSDEDEVVRLDATHYVVKLLYGGNVLVPITQKAEKILDIGTGSGIPPNKSFPPPLSFPKIDVESRYMDNRSGR